MITLGSLLRRIVWISSGLGVLIVTLHSFDGTPNSDAELLLIYGMGLLSFPTSVLVTLVLGALSEALYLTRGDYLQASYTSILVAWGVFLSSGYVQWFRGVPWVLRKVRARRRRERKKL